MNHDATDKVETMPSTVWVNAQVQSMLAGDKMLTLTHEAIPEWEWPEMTMDFTTTNSVDFSKLNEGLKLRVEITKPSSGDYQVSNTHVPDPLVTNNSKAMSNMDMTQNNEAETSVSSATVTGKVNSVMVEHGMINISRSAIEKWGRPAQTVDFITKDGVSLEGINKGMEVKFTFEVREGNFVIVEISQLANSESTLSSSATEEPAVDHSKQQNRS
jgi:Cu(I)/Ag(I) efflux system membrane fusion protein